MQDTVHALRALQELDQQIYRLRAEIRRLPEERKTRRAQVDALVKRRDDAKKSAVDLRTRVKEIDDLTTTQRQRMRKVENEAAGARGDVALQAAFQHQARTLKRDIEKAEEEGLGLLEQAQAFEGEQQKHQADLDAAEKTFAEFSANVDKELAAAKARLVELETERKTRLPATIQPESFGLYERLLASRNGVALAELDSRICQACFIEVPVNVAVRVARGTTLVQCPSCDRIFYLRG